MDGWLFFLQMLVATLIMLAYFGFVYQRSIREKFNRRMDTTFTKLAARYGLDPQEHYFLAFDKYSIASRFIVCEPEAFAFLDKKTGQLERIPYADIEVIKIPFNVRKVKAALHKHDGEVVMFALCDDLYDYAETVMPDSVGLAVRDLVVEGEDNAPEAAIAVHEWRELRTQVAYRRLAQACSNYGVAVELPSWPAPKPPPASPKG